LKLFLRKGWVSFFTYQIRADPPLLDTHEPSLQGALDVTMSHAFVTMVDDVVDFIC
jgi:hypothetical protein